MGVMQHRLSVRRALPVLKFSAVWCSGRRILFGAPMARLSILVFLLAAVFADSAGASRCGEPPSDEKVDFLGRDLERNDVNLSSYKGKIVVVSFWASWCPPCLEELPLLEGLQRIGGKDRIEVVAVNFNEDRRTVRKFLRRWGVDPQMTITRDYRRRVRKSLDVEAIPATYVFGSEGELQDSYCGYAEEDLNKLLARLNELIPHENPSKPDGHS